MWEYLWQCFLKDKKYIDSIINKINSLDFQFDAIFEIGPWKWALTKYLYKIWKPLYLFEKDTRFIDLLNQQFPGSTIIQWDVLDLDVAWFLDKHNLNINKILVVWNLPYYITSPILTKFLWDHDFQIGIFMIQKEVWEKISLGANKKSYLWWLLNYSHDVKIFKNVPAKAFSPAPKVDSCLISCIKQQSSLIPKDFILNFLELVSPYKRKTLWKIMKMHKEKWIKLEDKYSSYRVEQLNWDDLYSIYLYSK